MYDPEGFHSYQLPLATRILVTGVPNYFTHYNYNYLYIPHLKSSDKHFPSFVILIMGETVGIFL
jgi:hypothetical protein